MECLLREYQARLNKIKHDCLNPYSNGMLT